MDAWTRKHLENWLATAVRPEYQAEHERVILAAVENDPSLIDAGMTWYQIYDANKGA